ncbi:MAG TPA: ATP-binding cassette domain-containing protein, partial [Burkholderiaceae bacterium]
QLVDVALELHGRPLLGPIDAEVAPGEVLAVMGPSGAGKSALLAWMAGLLEPPFAARGRLRLDGCELHLLPVERRRIGLLFQDDLLFPHLTVADNLLFALPAGGTRAARGARVDAALAQADLAGYGERRPASLSGGQRARVSLLRALLAEPRALLLDEPFSRLDATLRTRFRDWVWATLAERRIAAVLVTHDPADVPPGARVIELPGHA